MPRQLSTPGPALPAGLARTLTVEKHSASSGPGNRISTWTNVPGSTEDARVETHRRPAIRTGSGTAPDEAPMLTVESHSGESRFGGRISTRECVDASLATSRPRVTRTVLRVASSVERLLLRALRADQGSRFTVGLHDASSPANRRRRAPKPACCEPRAGAHR